MNNLGLILFIWIFEYFIEPKLVFRRGAKRRGDESFGSV